METNTSKYSIKIPSIEKPSIMIHGYIYDNLCRNDEERVLYDRIINIRSDRHRLFLRYINWIMSNDDDLFNLDLSNAPIKIKGILHKFMMSPSEILQMLIKERKFQQSSIVLCEIPPERLSTFKFYKTLLTRLKSNLEHGDISRRLNNMADKRFLNLKYSITDILGAIQRGANNESRFPVVNISGSTTKLTSEMCMRYPSRPNQPSLLDELLAIKIGLTKGYTGFSGTNYHKFLTITH